jgi:hypothetical protein
MFVIITPVGIIETERVSISRLFGVCDSRVSNDGGLAVHLNDQLGVHALLPVNTPPFSHFTRCSSVKSAVDARWLAKMVQIFRAPLAKIE